MNKLNVLSVFLILMLTGVTHIYAQLNVGSTAPPPSTLNVIGSFGADYQYSAASAITLDSSNFYYAYNGSTPGLVNLPAALSGSGNYSGRMYYIKNAGTSLLTIQAAGAELIDNQDTVATSAFGILPGFVAQLISKGTTSGTTWELVLLGSAISGTPSSIQNYVGNTQAVVNQGVTANVPGAASSDIVVPPGQGQLAVIIITGYSVNNAINSIATSGVFALMQSTDGGTTYAKVTSAFASAGTGVGLLNLPNPTSFISMVELTPGLTYKFKIQYKSWNGAQKVNPDISNYVGYNGDDQSMATRMSIIVYNK